MQESTPVHPTDRPQPFVYSPSQTQSPQKSGMNKLLVFGCAGGCVVLVLAGLLAVFGLGYFGIGVFAEQVANDLRENPVVVEHLGTIQELDVDFIASSAVADENTFVFDAKGSKGTGRIRALCVTIDDLTESVVSGTLEMPTGEVYDLFPAGKPGAGPEAEP